MPSMTMPNPEGCYVRVWSTAQFSGEADYINGPRAYSDLRDMPGRRRWDKRIRSVEVGPTAIVTAYTDESFRGTTVPLSRGNRYSTLRERIGGDVAALRVDCADSRADLSPRQANANLKP